MRRTTLFTLALMTLLAACKKDDSPIAPGTPSELLPLKVGNRWAFTVTNFDSTGSMTSIADDTMLVLRDTMIQNQIWFYTNHGIYRNTIDGIWFWFNGPLFIYKYPASPSDSFNTVSATVKILSTSENLTVPYGVLSCYHYRAVFTNQAGFQTNDYLAPGIGFASFEGGAMTPAGKWYVNYREQLKSFTLQ